jgi:hypothetical protein
MINIIEQLRAASTSSLLRIKKFEHDLPYRLAFFRSKLGSKSKTEVIALGNYLSEAFQLLGREDRSQGSLSSAGMVWEALIVWYLNICLVGTRAVCLRGGTFCPNPIKDSITIMHESIALRSEPDVMIVSFPDLECQPPVASTKDMMAILDVICERQFQKVGIINIQCKTNWNDNAQIPMLWNMLYNQARKGAVIPNGFGIGRRGMTLNNAGFFGYAFATVPTQKKGPKGYKADSLEVLRVKSMSCGNYWGFPSISGVCLNISEIFNFFMRNISVFPNVSTIGEAATKYYADGHSEIFSPEQVLLP